MMNGLAMKENYQKRYPDNTSLTEYKQIKCEYRYMESFDKDQGFEHIYVARSNGEQWLVEEVETFDCKNEFEWPIYEIDLYIIISALKQALDPVRIRFIYGGVANENLLYV